MTVATATENSTYEPCEEPPIKKQKVEGGAAIATASAGSTDLSTEDVKLTKGRPKKRKRSKSKKTEFKIPCHEMQQFIDKHYTNVLWNYMHKIKGVVSPKLVFKTTEDIGYKLPGFKCYMSSCKVETVSGTISGLGRAKTKKKSRQMACLHIIQKLGLVPQKMKVDTMEVTLPPPPKKKEKPIKPIIEYNSYLRGNFKGALEQYLRRNALGEKVTENCDLVRKLDKPKEWEYVTTCTAPKGTQKGIGIHKYKRKSIQLAWLHLILDMKLISKEQHLEKHPPSAEKEKEEEKVKDAGKPSNSVLSEAVKESHSEKNETLSDPEGERTAPIVKQDVAKSEESAVDQSVDKPSRKLEQENQKMDEPSLNVDKQKESAQAQSTATANGKEEVIEKQTADEISEMVVETKDEASLNVDKQKEGALAQSSATANEKEEDIEKQTADEVSEMEVEDKAAT